MMSMATGSPLDLQDRPPKQLLRTDLTSSSEKALLPLIKISLLDDSLKTGGYGTNASM